ncbi:LPXTG cell wall anchor domain-containing protein [Micromonospora sp. WMMD961]|uniref:LPXTG cell wall anchor domain-containing protein n=1 Tax=Micromonospora sp. WMMD961 TaxID=3016100 RepID=UPI0024181028|nr:LPXTG cell wall anchor domain-containing protein [Micromonospora sp. WMMD961]MDG4784211.1 LPXTG cell wall anchor domain-containing protein [Micromonospora sp. WMMD961]
MGGTAASYLVGGALAATASLALAVPPVLSSEPASARAGSAARAEPSAGSGVTFEILPATPTPTPTPTPPTPTPTTPQPTPSHGGQLPVTGSGGSTPLLVGLGATLLLVGFFAARRAGCREGAGDRQVGRLG